MRRISGIWGGRRGDHITPSTDYAEFYGVRSRRLQKHIMSKRRRQFAKLYILDNFLDWWYDRF